MNEPLSQSQAAERALFRRLVDDQLSPEEFAALQQRLLADREFRLAVRALHGPGGQLVRRVDRRLRRCPTRKRGAAAGREGAAGSRSPPRRSHWPARWRLPSTGRRLLARRGLRRGRAPHIVEAKLRGLEVAAIITHVEGLPADGSR